MTLRYKDVKAPIRSNGDSIAICATHTPHGALGEINKAVFLLQQLPSQLSIKLLKIEELNTAARCVLGTHLCPTCSVSWP